MIAMSDEFAHFPECLVMKSVSINGSIAALSMAAVSSLVMVPLSASAASLNQTVVDFSEYTFPSVSTIVEGRKDYNLFNDVTGAKLTSDNGDVADFSLEFSNSGAQALSATGTPNLKVDGKKIVSTRGFNKPVTNNPGTLVSTTVKLLFGANWSITDFTADFTSLNTGSALWEYATLGFLKPDGTMFSPAPPIAAYNNATSFTGSPSLGWYVAASKATVQGVGTAKTGTVGNGASDNLKLTYAAAGLTPGTAIGGLVWTSYLADVRGVENGISSLTASWTGFTVSGQWRSTPTIATMPVISQPVGNIQVLQSTVTKKVNEPMSGAFALFGVVGFGAIVCRRNGQAPQK
jgi:hypothetical protein